MLSRGAAEHIGKHARAAAGAAQPVVSVALAVFAAHRLGLQDSWWAAISAVMVMQGGFVTSLYRGVLRLIGTILGGAAALVLGVTTAPYPLLFAAVMALATWGCLYAALRYRHSYAWVLMLVTFAMVMCEAVNPQGHLGPFALERVANVVVGTAACILVVALVELRALIAELRGRHDLRDRLGSSSGRLAETPIPHQDAALHAMHGAVAMALLAIAISRWATPSLAQGMITTIAVLVVPLDTSARHPRVVVTQRMVQRFIGCLLAGAVAFALFPLIEGQPFWCQAALCLGVWAASYLQDHAPGLRYGAVQFMVAFIMVFVQDQGWSIEERPALERLSGVAVGIATLYAVLMLSQAWLARSSSRQRR